MDYSIKLIPLKRLESSSEQLSIGKAYQNLSSPLAGQEKRENLLSLRIKRLAQFSRRNLVSDFMANFAIQFH